jgi:hypothetical protein
MGNIKGRLDRLESALGRGQSRVMVYTVGIGVPGEEIEAWLQRQKEAGVISEHDLMVRKSVYTLVYAQAGLMTLPLRPRKDRPILAWLYPCLRASPGPVRDARNDWCHCTFVE